jgi:hypothetical protein
MPGWTANGLPIPGPATVNGTALTAPAGTYPQLSSLSQVSVDTEQSSGASPQSVGAYAAQIAMIACAMVKNTQTSTVAAATSNTFSGQIVTEALTTAPAATYSMVLTNSLIAVAPAATTFSGIIFDIRSGTNTKVGMQPTSYTTAAGSVTLVFTNNGTAAVNGTFVIAWHLVP